MLAVLKAIVRIAWRWLNRVRRLAFFLVRGSTVLLICLMLLLNVAILTISSVNAAISTAIETATGISTVSSRQSAKLEAAEARASKLNSDLQRSKSDLSIEKQKSGELAKRNRNLEVETRQLRAQGPDVMFRGEKRSMKSVAEEVSGSVSKRTAKVAATNVGSMAGEGIPFWGIAVIVASTTVEAAAACETMKDMHDLQKALDSGSDLDDGASEVCGMRIPTREEIWETVKGSPAAVWKKMTKLFTRLPSPDFDSWWARALATFSWE